MQIEQTALQRNGERRSRPALAARLKAVRAEISFLHAAPYSYGLNGPHRRRRDEDILLTIAADLNARMIEARTT
jgi:hypothetical protein